MPVEKYLMKKHFNNTGLSDDSKKYLVSITDDFGIESTSVKMKVIGQSVTGITKPKIVVSDSFFKGFLKDSSLFDDGDDLELVINCLGRMCGVPMAEEYRVFDCKFEREALLSVDVARGENENFLDFYQVLSECAEKVQNQALPLKQWMRDWIKINSQPAFLKEKENFEFECKEAVDYDTAIQLPMNLLSMKYPNGVQTVRNFEKKYFLMIVFDIFTGQTDRNLHNYGIIQRSKTFEFAPLFDNATLEKPYLPINLYSLNQVVMDREQLFMRLIKGYSQHTSEPVNKIIQLYEEKRKEIFNLIDMWINNDNKNLLKNNMDSAYLMFKKYV